jgi:hypothetical protein
VNRFVDRTIEAEVSTGQCFHPMKVLVNYFQPKGSDLLSVHHITAVTELSSPQLVRHDSAPVGMMALSTSEMKIVCRDHIEKMVQKGEYALETTSGDPTQIPFLVLEVVTNYAFAGNVSVVVHLEDNQLIECFRFRQFGRLHVCMPAITS